MNNEELFKAKLSRLLDCAPNKGHQNFLRKVIDVLYSDVCTAEDFFEGVSEELEIYLETGYCRQDVIK